MTNDLEIRFKYHKPTTDLQIEKYAEIRQRAYDFAQYISGNVPDSREQSLAITKLEEVVMWANAGIARNGDLKCEAA